MDNPYLIYVTDTRTTQYIIHSDDPGEAIRECGDRGIQIWTTGDVRAQAIQITESDYDRALEGSTRFEVNLGVP